MIEGFTFGQNTIEGYTFVPDSQPGTIDFSNNLQVLQEKSNTNYLLDTQITNNYYDLSRNVFDLSNNYTNTYKQYKYNKLIFPDKTDMIKNTADVRQDDINTFVLQQNYIYMIGTVTCATLLIAAIIISK